MAKPIVELLTELQDAAEAEDTAYQAMQAKSKAHTETVAKAKAAYDGAVAASQAELEAASDAYVHAAECVKSLQDDVNSVLGRVDSRVRQG